MTKILKESTPVILQREINKLEEDGYECVGELIVYQEEQKQKYHYDHYNDEEINKISVKIKNMFLQKMKKSTPLPKPIKPKTF